MVQLSRLLVATTCKNPLKKIGAIMAHYTVFRKITDKPDPYLPGIA